jgi:hypothetical protein
MHRPALLVMERVGESLPGLDVSFEKKGHETLLAQGSVRNLPKGKRWTRARMLWSASLVPTPKVVNLRPSFF